MNYLPTVPRIYPSSAISNVSKFTKIFAAQSAPPYQWTGGHISSGFTLIVVTPAAIFAICA
jgi:hypothetical protein